MVRFFINGAPIEEAETREEFATVVLETLCEYL